MPRFRDSETGQFVSEETYNRSVSHGGDRYESEMTESEMEAAGIIDSIEDYEDIDWGDIYDFDIDEFGASADYGEI